MALQFGNTKIGEMQYNGFNIAEAMYNGEIVFRGGYALPKSAPDYWYSMENDAHWFNRGSSDVRLRYHSGMFANRGDHAYSNQATPHIDVAESWADGFTMAGWFHITAYSSWPYLFARSASPTTAQRLYVVATPPSDSSPYSVALRFDGTGNDLSSWVRGPANIVPSSGWFHFALTWTYTGTRNVSTVYIDGVPVWNMEWATSLPRLSFYSTDRVSVTNTATSSHYPLYANIDDIALWSRTLSGSEIRDIASDGPVPTSALEPVSKAHPLLPMVPSVWLPATPTPGRNLGTIGSAASGYAPSPTRATEAGYSYNQYRGGHHRVIVTDREWPDGGTIGGWHRDPGGSTTGRKTIMQRASLPSVTNRWELYMSVDPRNGRLLAGAQVNGVWWDVQFGTNSINIVDGNWHYIAATLSRSGSRWTLTAHVDATSVSSSRNSASVGEFPYGAFYVGGGRDGSRSNVDIKDAVMIDRPLSSADLAAIYAAGRWDMSM